MGSRIPPAEASAMGYETFGFQIPDRMARVLDGYITEGGPTGAFLTAVICNDLQEAVATADRENLANLPAFTYYLYNCAPAPCWGSRAKMDAWRAQFAAEPKPTTPENPK